MNVLFIGDVVGSIARRTIKKIFQEIKQEYKIDYCIANGENAADGKGITFGTAQELYDAGVDIITMGNHTWAKKDILNFIDIDNCIIRPSNFPESAPGKGCTVLDNKIGVINLLGRVSLLNVDCPFRAAERDIKFLEEKGIKIIIVDMHAEATSEKCALAWYLDGRVSCVLGTHTHVQTADERIFPQGTAFISDVGMTGPYNSIIGVDKDISIKMFMTCIHEKFKVATGPVQFNAVVLEIDEITGNTVSIQRVFKIIPY